MKNNADIEADILRVLDSGSKTICGLYRLLPEYDIGCCELDAAIIRLKEARKVIDSGKQSSAWGNTVVWEKV